MRPTVVGGGQAGPIYGRQAELALIDVHLGQALDGRSEPLHLCGEAGIGKTALLRAAADAARDQGFTVLSARGARMESGFALEIVRQLLEPVLYDAAPADRERLLA